MAKEINQIEVVWNNDLHLYQIDGVEQKVIDDFILKNTSKEIATLDTQTGAFITTYEPIVKIENDADNKLVWKLRTNLNKKKKEIETKRKQAVAIMINNFVNYCKGIENQIDLASKNLTRLLNEYKPKEIKETKKYFTIKITSDNFGAIQKLEGIAMSMGLEVETTEEEK